jgi:pyruvate/oxaloacetate carboxyltransferase
VEDRGYNDYPTIACSDAGVRQGAFFVTRMKSHTLYEVVQQRLIMPKGNIVNDQLVRLSGRNADDKCPHVLRRVEAVREDTGETLVFVCS